MNCGVTRSGSPNQNGSTPGSPMPALAISRIFEPRSERMRSRAIATEATSGIARSVEGPAIPHLTVLHEARRWRAQASDRDLERVSTLTFCCIERAVCALQQRFGGCRQPVAERDPNAGRDLDCAVARMEIAAHRRDDLAGN